MAGVNLAIVLGNLGADPELRQLPNGGAVVNLRVATSESWKDKQTGEKHERTEWHSITLYNRLAEVAAQYLKKGSQVWVQGKLQTRKWQDKSGNDRYTTEIIGNQMQMVGSRNSGSSSGASTSSNPVQPNNQSSQGAYNPSPNQFDDDIPF